MSDAQLNDVGHENAPTRGDIVAATVIAQFYDFASRCMDWRRVPALCRNGRSMCRWGCNGLPPGLGYKLSYNLRAPKTCP
jgi:hypothetical protein